MSLEAKPTVDEREAYMKVEGFLLFTDVGEKLLSHLAEQNIPRLQPKNVHEYYRQLDNGIGVSNANIALFNVSELLIAQIPHRNNMLDGEERREFYGIDKDEAKRADKHTYDLGIDDMDFPWHFSPWLANACVHSFVDDERITIEDAAKLTLDDWADIIGSRWFSTLMNSLSLTGFGVFKSSGKCLWDYKRESFKLLMVEASDKYNEPRITGINVFDVDEREDLDDGNIYITASLNPAYKNLLSAIRKKSIHLDPKIKGKSIGCPVARKAVILPADYAEAMPRAVKLQELGHLSISDTVNADGTVLATQEFTETDRTLSFIAAQLRTYDELYGTPQFTNGVLRHRRLPPTNILIRPKSKSY